MERESPRWFGPALLGSALALLLLACVATVLDTRQNDAPPQGWWKERGPVVPHDSFPADCSLCHTGADWHTIRADFVFDHDGETGVALVGAHAQAECLRCHNDRGPVATFAARGCSGCHEDVHRAQLGKDCVACHVESDWQVREAIAKHSETRFPLVGAHAAAACWRCHPGADVGDFARASTECIACHASDLARASVPDHQALGYVDACERCHLPTSWQGAAFDHSTWPLTGAHRGADCAACHANGVFAGTPTDCAACHLEDYQATTDPNHVAAGFPTQCETCHTTSTWAGALFDHSSWPLTGAHTSVDCSACHLGGVYAGTPTDCAACHLDDYAATTDPNHASAGFPTSCEDCHSTSGWEGADFDHPFPIDSGAHKELDCADCHVSADYEMFSCMTCHEHSQQKMDDKHSEVGGYVYQAAACYACHPNGK